MNGGQRRSDAQLNVLGDPITSCSHDPVTGFFRDGCCNTGPLDQGLHTVCAIVTSAFLEFSKAVGNDLSTPRPEFGFAGLKAGDQWCLWRPLGTGTTAGHARKFALPLPTRLALPFVIWMI